MHTTFEISITRYDATNNEVGFVNRCFDLFWKRTGISDTCCTAVSYNVEAKSVQIVLQSCRFVVFCHDSTSWGKRCFHPRFDVHSKRPSLTSEKTCCEHNVGIRCIGAGGNGCDDDVSMVQIVHFSILFEDCSIVEFGCFKTMALMTDFIGQGLYEMGFHILEINSVLWSFWACKCRQNCS